MVVGILRRRPLARRNRATAWLAAAMVLADGGHDLPIYDRELAGITDDVETGRIDVDELAAMLADASTSSPRPIGTCPACGRTLHVLPQETTPSGTVLVGWSDFELTARCWYEHRAHDRRGRGFAPPPFWVLGDAAATLTAAHPA